MGKPFLQNMAGELTKHPMQRKPQQQTLSLRIPTEVRNHLERAREVFASHKHEFLATSDVGKFLVESAIDDRLDDRVEVDYPVQMRAAPRSVPRRMDLSSPTRASGL